MVLPVIQTSDEFLHARLHGLWAVSVHGETLRGMTALGTVESLEQALHPFGVTDSDAFHRSLLIRELERLERISRFLQEDMAAVYRVVASHVQFRNLKLLLHRHFFPERSRRLEPLVVHHRILPELDVSALLEATSTAAFLAALPKSLLPRMTPIVEAMADSGDIMAAECTMDKLYYDLLLEAVSGARSAFRKAMEGLMRHMVDAFNLTILLRNERHYDYATSRLENLWADGGSMTAPFLSRLADMDDPAAMLSLLPRPYRDLLLPLHSQEIHVSENALLNAVYHRAHAEFKASRKAWGALAAYPFLLHVETLNLGRLYEGIRLAMQPEAIQTMMIGL